MDHTAPAATQDLHAPPDHDTAHHIEKHVRMYLGVGLALICLTGFTVFLSYVNFGSSEGNIIVAMIVAVLKAGLVAYIFMHLGSEKKFIYRFLIITAVFVTGLFALTGLAFHDPIRINPADVAKASQIKADEAALRQQEAQP